MKEIEREMERDKENEREKPSVTGQQLSLYYLSNQRANHISPCSPTNYPTLCMHVSEGFYLCDGNPSEMERERQGRWERGRGGGVIKS